MIDQKIFKIEVNEELEQISNAKVEIEKEDEGRKIALKNAEKLLK